MKRSAGSDQLQLAELIASLSLATDLGLGQPSEHVLRCCLLAQRIAERLGLDEESRADLYYVALLAWVGCHADSFEQASWFGDDIAVRAATYDAELAGPGAAAFLLRHVGAGRPPLRRMQLLGSFVASGSELMESIDLTHCRLAGDLAGRLGLRPSVAAALQHAFARWDGKGAPPGLAGEEIALAARITAFADTIEVQHSRGGPEAALKEAKRRRGGLCDPQLCDLLTAEWRELLAGLAEASGWSEVIACAPALDRRLQGPAIDEALEAVSEFTDLKSPWFAGHSRAVAELAHAAALRSGLPRDDAVTLRRAALVHDIGRIGVSNAIWDKPGPLSHAELERVRLYPYLTQRILSDSPLLRRLGELAARHSERLDGSGYPAGLGGDALSPSARILAAADVYRAIREPRPHRPAKPEEAAATELREEARAGRLELEAVEAVLGAAGHRARKRRQWPAGLTAREVEVLRLLARGHSNRQVAEELVISPKTASHHIEHIYGKIGCSTRAEASLFAMRHGLLSEPGDRLPPGEKMGRTPHEGTPPRA